MHFEKMRHKMELQIITAPWKLGIIKCQWPSYFWPRIDFLPCLDPSTSQMNKIYKTMVILKTRVSGSRGLWSLGDRKQTWALWLSRLIVLRECPDVVLGRTNTGRPSELPELVTEMGVWLEFIGQRTWSHTERSAEVYRGPPSHIQQKDTSTMCLSAWGNYTRWKNLAERIQKNSTCPQTWPETMPVPSVKLENLMIDRVLGRVTQRILPP